MGTFSVPIEVGDILGARFVGVDAVVDTGSTYTCLPGSVLSGLGIAVSERRPFELADDRIVQYDIGDARLRLDGREHFVVVVFGPEGSSPLLGATTLELFGLGVDPVARRLILVTGLMK